MLLHQYRFVFTVEHIQMLYFPVCPNVFMFTQNKRFPFLNFSIHNVTLHVQMLTDYGENTILKLRWHASYGQI